MGAERSGAERAERSGAGQVCSVEGHTFIGMKSERASLNHAGSKISHDRFRLDVEVA